MTQKPLFVTQPSLPPLEEFLPYLEKIWESKVLTNSGPFHNQLETELAAYLGVPHVLLCNNGTNALITAVQALDLSGEVITTPYTFVATAHALLWNKLTPVFVDVDSVTLNLDPAQIEQAITPKTSAILAVHCYGQPCDVNAINAIAQKHGLKVIYDAAHAFGIKDRQGESILNHGDLSILSFHATKVFNTFEGGAIICQNEEMRMYLTRLRNFGIKDQETITSLGSNAKMSEINAAFGLVQLKHVDAEIAARKHVRQRYLARLEGVAGIRCLAQNFGEDGNYGYFPILVQKPYPLTRDDLFEACRSRGILTRKYFYPLISDMAPYEQYGNGARLPVAQQAATEVLCLPIFAAMNDTDVDKVCECICNP